LTGRYSWLKNRAFRSEATSNARPYTNGHFIAGYAIDLSHLFEDLQTRYGIDDAG